MLRPVFRYTPQRLWFKIPQRLRLVCSGLQQRLLSHLPNLFDMLLTSLLVSATRSWSLSLSGCVSAFSPLPEVFAVVLSSLRSRFKIMNFNELKCQSLSLSRVESLCLFSSLFLFRLPLALILSPSLILSLSVLRAEWLRVGRM